MSEGTVCFSRGELYERIWTMPITRFAGELGISDVAVAKACKRLGVPTPPRGYWARLAARQKVRRTPLPAAKPRTPVKVTFERREPRPEEPWASREPPIEVSAELDQAHPLVLESRRVLAKLKPDRLGVLRGSQARCLSIDVTPPCVDRALRIMEALIERLGSQGMPVEVLPPRKLYVWKPSVSLEHQTLSVTRVQVDGEWLPIALEETIESREVPKPVELYTRAASERYTLHATGRLTLRIRKDLEEYGMGRGLRASWSDGANQRLERVLHQFVEGLRLMARDVAAARQKAEQRRLEAEAQRQAQEARAAAERAEADRRKAVEEFIPHWRLAKELRAYMADIRAIVSDAGLCIEPDSEMGEWLRWCDGYADRVDPLTAVRREVARVKREEAGAAGASPEP
jgi:hypothetical protein